MGSARSLQSRWDCRWMSVSSADADGTDCIFSHGADRYTIFRSRFPICKTTAKLQGLFQVCVRIGVSQCSNWNRKQWRDAVPQNSFAMTAS